jgi:hypothetical protein
MTHQFLEYGGRHTSINVPGGKRMTELMNVDVAKAELLAPVVDDLLYRAITDALAAL